LLTKSETTNSKRLALSLFVPVHRIFIIPSVSRGLSPPLAIFALKIITDDKIDKMRKEPKTADQARELARCVSTTRKAAALLEKINAENAGAKQEPEKQGTLAFD
jgi:hypothetical protein